MIRNNPFGRYSVAIFFMIIVCHASSYCLRDTIKIGENLVISLMEKDSSRNFSIIEAFKRSKRNLIVKELSAKAGSLKQIKTGDKIDSISMEHMRLFSARNSRGKIYFVMPFEDSEANIYFMILGIKMNYFPEYFRDITTNNFHREYFYGHVTTKTLKSHKQDTDYISKVKKIGILISAKNDCRFLKY